MRRWGIAWCAGAWLLGCGLDAVFGCVEPEQCGPSAARCEPNGYCSFEDVSCESGWKYGDFAGGGLAGACVSPGVAQGGETGETDGGESTSAMSLEPEGSGSGTAGDPATTEADSSEPAESSTGDTGDLGDLGDGLDLDGTSSTSGSTTDPGSDDGSSGTGTTPPGLPALPAVTEVSCFDNALGDGVVDAYWRPPVLAAGTSVVESGGELILTLITDPAFVALESETARGRIGTRVRVEVLEIPERTANHTQLLFGIGDGTDRVVFEVTAGQIFARNDRSIDGAVSYERAGGRTFDEVEHRFLQITILDDEVWWGTSADGVDYETFVDPIPTPVHLAEVDNRTQILGGTFLAQVDPPVTGRVRIRAFQDCTVEPM